MTMFKNRKDFDDWLKSVPDEEKEPFCPFECGYCNEAYSEECFKCLGRNLRADE